MSKGIRVSSYHKAGGTITLSGIPAEVFEKVEGVVSGHQWMIVEKGEARFWPTREPLPGPAADEEMLPFWRRNEHRQCCLKGLMFDHEESGHESPSFMVKHLCGYYFTPEKYLEQAERLERYGFVCMRSRRGDDGRFWETWYLPGAWAAKDELETRVAEVAASSPIDDFTIRCRRETAAVIAFLRKNVSFGQLDVVVQRAAMVIDD